jgi:hypothetical protein
MPDGTARRQPLKVPLAVLGNVHRRTGLGWEWSCNFKGCSTYGVRTELENAWDAIADHWQRDHRSTGGKRR